jgi:hypothetical protein
LESFRQLRNVQAVDGALVRLASDVPRANARSGRSLGVAFPINDANRSWANRPLTGNPAFPNSLRRLLRIPVNSRILWTLTGSVDTLSTLDCTPTRAHMGPDWASTHCWSTHWSRSRPENPEQKSGHGFDGLIHSLRPMAQAPLEMSRPQAQSSTLVHALEQRDRFAPVSAESAFLSSPAAPNEATPAPFVVALADALSLDVAHAGFCGSSTQSIEG